ncbi:hypothetical protein ACIHJG_35735 [Streptomyces sp. NPDC052415]|uniref:hypothetical protein n=1 Tax=Streptomyces sp. NPDC052415 TaxID=3365690 RepID=UPI0037D2A352
MGKEMEVLRTAFHPVALLNASRHLVGAAVRWTTAEKGETANRVFAWVGLLFVCGVLAYNYPGWALAALPAWLLGCGAVALQNPAHQKQRAAAGEECEPEEEEEYETEEEDDEGRGLSGYENEEPDSDEQDHETGESQGRYDEAERARQESGGPWSSAK